jgi:hypothetical protein
LFLTVEAIIALIAPPNNWDSMTYHMGRVVHWIQNKNVSFYPTHIDRQNFLTPWAEFAIMQLQILYGGDRFANLVQWFSMVGSVIGVSLIARELGGNRRAQLLAGVIAVLIPMGILQSTSTQNDLVVGFWIICFIYFAFRLMHGLDMSYAIASGCALGLAMLTKSTAYIVLLPFLIWWVIAFMRGRKYKIAGSLKYFVAIGLIAITLNLPHFIRNQTAYGTPFGHEDRVSLYSNERVSLPILFSNLVRNLALHAGTRLTPLNDQIEELVGLLLGSEIDNPDSTWPNTTLQIRRTLSEDTAGSPAHLLLIITSCLLLIWTWTRVTASNKDPRIYALVLIAAFVIFSVYLRWNPWHGRLHLSMLFLWSPFVAVILTRKLNHRLLSLLLILLVIYALPYLIQNQSRPLVGESSIISTSRLDLYFVKQQRIRTAYNRAVDVIVDNCITDVGIDIGGDEWEYPIWTLFDDRGWEPRIEHVNVHNPSATLGPEVQPQIIWSSKNRERIMLGSDGYDEVWNEVVVKDHYRIGLFYSSSAQQEHCP